MKGTACISLAVSPRAMNGNAIKDGGVDYAECR